MHFWYKKMLFHTIYNWCTQIYHIFSCILFEFHIFSSNSWNWINWINIHTHTCAHIHVALSYSYLLCTLVLYTWHRASAIVKCSIHWHLNTFMLYIIVQMWYSAFWFTTFIFVSKKPYFYQCDMQCQNWSSSCISF